MLKKGKIVETGDHFSLLKDYPQGIYAKLVQQQENQDGSEENSPQRVKDEWDDAGNIKEGHTHNIEKYDFASNKKVEESLPLVNEGSEGTERNSAIQMD